MVYSLTLPCRPRPQGHLARDRAKNEICLPEPPPTALLPLTDGVHGLVRRRRGEEGQGAHLRAGRVRWVRVRLLRAAAAGGGRRRRRRFPPRRRARSRVEFSSCPALVSLIYHYMRKDQMIRFYAQSDLSLILSIAYLILCHAGVVRYLTPQTYWLLRARWSSRPRLRLVQPASCALQRTRIGGPANRTSGWRRSGTKAK